MVAKYERHAFFFLLKRVRARKRWIKRPLRKTIDWLVVDTYEVYRYRVIIFNVRPRDLSSKS